MDKFMSKFQKLADLYQDIELLENAGKIKAADILHKKFMKEAQLEPQRDSGPYRQVFENYLRSQPSPGLIEKIRNDGFLLRQDQDSLIAYITKKLTPSPTTATPAATPAATPTVTPTGVAQGFINGIPAQPSFNFPDTSNAYNPQSYSGPARQNTDIALQQQPQQQNPAESDTANYNAAIEPLYAGINQVSQPQIVTQTPKVNEQELYMHSLNEIKELFKTKRPDAINAAEQLYVNTYTQLTNDSSKKLFAQQIQRLRNQYNTARLKGQR